MVDRRSTSGAGSARSRPTTATSYPFHCTRIADGTRTIAVGTPVEFEVVAGQPRPLGSRRDHATLTRVDRRARRDAESRVLLVLRVGDLDEQHLGLASASRRTGSCSPRRAPRPSTSAARASIASPAAARSGSGGRPCSSGGVTTPRWTSASCQMPSAWLAMTSSTGVATSRACSSRSAAISSGRLGGSGRVGAPGLAPVRVAGSCAARRCPEAAHAGILAMSDNLTTREVGPPVRGHGRRRRPSPHLAGSSPVVHG